MKCAAAGLLFCVVFVIGIPAPARAATLYLNPTTAEIHPGDSITMAVRVDTAEDECINVVDAVITYDPSIQPVDISRGRSIMPIWAEEPVIDTKNNRVTFAGGIPNGYCGRIEGDPRLTNTVLELIFQAPGFRIGAGTDNPTSTIRFAPETTVLLNDGFGTKAELSTTEAQVFVHKTPGSSVRDQWNTLVTSDKQLPEDFSITLLQDASIFDGKYVIVFNTTDKQSGIDHYEVIEEPLDSLNFFGFGAADAPWVTARSPYLLRDQSLNSTIRVKALDKAGNEYIATFIPEESQRTFSQQQKTTYAVMAVVGVMLLILAGAVLFYIRRVRRLRREVNGYSYDEVE